MTAKPITVPDITRDEARRIAADHFTLATASPARVRETQPDLGLSMSQPSASAYAMADARFVLCSDKSLMAMS
jgi:hypothetical protein